MLKIIRSFREIDMEQLADVYKESLNASADENHCMPSEYERAAYAYSQFWEDTREFFLTPGAFYGVWAPEGRYVTALRIESYRDGWLVAGLETALEARRKGYGKKLLEAVIQFLSEAGPLRLYSHIHKKNIPSVNLHTACGFTKLRSCAVFLDGSISQQYDTYILQK